MIDQIGLQVHNINHKKEKRKRKKRKITCLRIKSYDTTGISMQASGRS